MLMCLMDGRKLLILTLQSLFFHGLLRFLFLFILLYILVVKKSIPSSTSSCRKKDSQFDRKKEMEAMKEDRKLFFVCYVLDRHYSVNSIIHWTDLNLYHCSCNIVDIFKKTKENFRQTGNKVVEISCLVYFRIFWFIRNKEYRKLKLLNLLKWIRREAVRKIIQLLHITVVTSYQDATAGKIYNYLIGSSGLEIWNQKISKALSCMRW